MEKKPSLILDDEFILYCKINNITDVEKFATEVFTKGFNLTKYGSTPFTRTPTSTPLPREISVQETLPQEKVKKNDLYDE